MLIYYILKLIKSFIDVIYKSSVSIKISIRLYLPIYNIIIFFNNIIICNGVSYCIFIDQDG